MEIDPAWRETDFYATLGVSPDASKADITKAYRRLARELHPDTNADPAAGDRFKAVSAAYEVLGDPDKRAAYDQARRRSASGAGRRPGGGYTIRVDNRDDLSGFGFGSRPGGGTVFDDLLGFGPRRTRPRRGADVRAELSLPFAEAVTGTSRTVTVPGRDPVTVRIPPGSMTARPSGCRARDGRAAAAVRPATCWSPCTSSPTGSSVARAGT